MQGLSDVSINIVPGHRFPIWLLQLNSSTSDRVIDHLILAGYLVVTRHRGLPYRALNIWGGIFGACRIWPKLENMDITEKPFLRRFRIQCSQVCIFPN